jgi:hypothetical protein
MGRLLSDLGNRVFLMNNVHEDHHSVFQSRWALSYLRGPLTRDQIGRLMAEKKTKTASGRSGSMPRGTARDTAETRAVLPPEITERFAARRANLPAGATVVYHPALLGQAKLHFSQAAAGVDCWQDVSLLVAIDDSVPAEPWTEAEEQRDGIDLENQPEGDSRFSALPAELFRPKRYAELASGLKDHLYRNRKLLLWKCAPFKQTSAAGESESEFRARLTQRSREERDGQIEALRLKYSPKIATLQERKRKAEIKVEKERSQASQKTLSATLSIGASLLNAMFSRKLTSAGNISRAATSVRQASRIARERQDVSDANESVEVLAQRLADMEAELRAETEKIQTDLSPDKLPLDELVLKPKKSEITVSGVTLVWLPWLVRADENSEPAF